MSDRVTIAAYRTAEGGTQIQIAQLDAEGAGFGHRLAGPKHYNLPTTTLTERELDVNDAAEIRRMLDAVHPVALTDVSVYELRKGTRAWFDLVARYSTRAAAQAHGEAAYRESFGTTDDLAWHPDDPTPTTNVGLYATDVDGEETETDWHVAIVAIPAEYTPEGDAYDGMTNADVIGADELYEMDQDAEFAHDAAVGAEAGESE